MGDFDRPLTTSPDFRLPSARETVDRFRSEALDLFQQVQHLPKTAAERLLDRSTTLHDVQLSADDSPTKTLLSASLRERTASLDFASSLGTARLSVSGGEAATGLNNYFNLPHWQRWGYQFDMKSANENFSLHVSSPQAKQSPEVGFSYLRTPNSGVNFNADFHTHHYSFGTTRNINDRNRLQFNMQVGPHNNYGAGLMWDVRYR